MDTNPKNIGWWTREAVYQFINKPESKLGIWYGLLLFGAIVASILITLIEVHIPFLFRFGSWELYIAEWIFLVIFGSELIARLYSWPLLTWKGRQSVGEYFMLAIDIAVVTGSILVINHGVGDISDDALFIGALRILRLARIMKLVRKSHLLEHLFGRRIFTAVFGSVIGYVGLVSVFGLLHKNFPGLKTYLPTATSETGMGLILVGFAIIISILGAMTLTKGHSLKGQIARLQTDLRGLADDVLEMRDTERTIDPTVAEKAIRAYLNGKISQQEIYVKLDNWCTQLLRLFINTAKEENPAELVQFRNAIAVAMADASAVFASASHHNPLALYNFLNLLSHFLLGLTAYAFSSDLIGLLVVIVTTFMVRGILIAVEDIDFATDPDKSMCNIALQLFPEWPSRTPSSE